MRCFQLAPALHMRKIRALFHLLDLTFRRLTNGPLSHHEKWRIDRGDKTLRLDYPLSPNSVVVDAGAYLGDWTAQIATKYDPRIYLFEPAPEYVEALKQRFHGNPKVVIQPFALGDADRTGGLSTSCDGSSMFRSQELDRQIQIRDVCAALEQLDVPSIDLLKLNVEGAEYEILARLHQGAVLSKIKFIQVQFHPFPADYLGLYSDCCRFLEESHEIQYKYPFVWESWKRKQ